MSRVVEGWKTKSHMLTELAYQCYHTSTLLEQIELVTTICVATKKACTESRGDVEGVMVIRDGVTGRLSLGPCLPDLSCQGEYH